jgi:hypothetical protein
VIVELIKFLIDLVIDTFWIPNGLSEDDTGGARRLRKLDSKDGPETNPKP